MIFNDRDGKDEEIKRIQEQKAIELEQRRLALIKRGEIKHRVRQQQIERKEAEEAKRVKEPVQLKVRQQEIAERLAKELLRRKNIEEREANKRRKARSTVSAVSDCALKKIGVELNEQSKRDDETQTYESYSRWGFSEDVETNREEKKLKYRKELQDQIIYNRRRLREEEEENHRERKIMEEVGEMMQKEDQEAEKKKRETAALLQAEREAFLKARQLWKEKRRDNLKYEHGEISRIISEKEAQLRKEAGERSDTQAAKEAISKKLGEKLIEDERKKMEREEICRELYLAEKENELAKEAMELAMEKKRTARELMEDMAKNQKVEAERRAKEIEIDAAFAKYLADERRNLEERKRQEIQARRERAIQYGNELREAIARNKLQRTKDAAQADANEAEENEEGIKCNSESVIGTWKSREQKNETST